MAQITFPGGYNKCKEYNMRETVSNYQTIHDFMAALKTKTNHYILGLSMKVLQSVSMYVSMSITTNLYIMN